MNTYCKQCNKHCQFAHCESETFYEEVWGSPRAVQEVWFVCKKEKNGHYPKINEKDGVCLDYKLKPEYPSGDVLTLYIQKDYKGMSGMTMNEVEKAEKDISRYSLSANLTWDTEFLFYVPCEEGSSIRERSGKFIITKKDKSTREISLVLVPVKGVYLRNQFVPFLPAIVGPDGKTTLLKGKVADSPSLYY